MRHHFCGQSPRRNAQDDSQNEKDAPDDHDQPVLGDSHPFTSSR